MTLNASQTMLPDLDAQMHAIRVTPALLRALCGLDERKGAWRASPPLTHSRRETLRQQALGQTVAARTHHAGIPLDTPRIHRVLSASDPLFRPHPLPFPFPPIFQSHSEQDAAGYAKALHAVQSEYAALTLTKDTLVRLHQHLLEFRTEEGLERGQYKTRRNAYEAKDAQGVSMGAVLETPSAVETPTRMQEMLLWTREQMTCGVWHPLLVVSVFGARFLAIRPFREGNEELARLLTVLLLLQAGYAFVPYSSLEALFLTDTDAWQVSLMRTLATLHLPSPNWQPWVGYFLEVLVQHAECLEQAVAREKAGFEPAEAQKGLPALSAGIVTLVREQGRVTSAQMEATTGSSRSSVKARLKELVQTGHLVRHGNARATWYTLAEPADGARTMATHE